MGLLTNFRTTLLSVLAAPLELSARLVPLELNPPTCSARVIATYPHDSGAFTQGLCWDAGTGTLLESTGMYGRSSVRRVELRSGRVLQSEALPQTQFGEGLTLHDGRCVQLLWHGGKGLVRDAKTFKVQQQFELPEGCDQGWGLTHDGGEQLFLSDGSANIYVLDARDFGLRRTLSVRAGLKPLRRINELQYIRGELWANVWGDQRLAVICPASGAVQRFIDLSGLMSAAERRRLEDPREHVLNGIAHDEQGDRLFVTGKCWPNIFQVSVHSPKGVSPEASEFASQPVDGGEIARRPLQGKTAAERAAQRAARSAE